MEKTARHLPEHGTSSMTERELLCIQVTVAGHLFLFSVFSLQVEKTARHLPEHGMSSVTKRERLCVQETVARHLFQPTGEDSMPPT